MINLLKIRPSFEDTAATLAEVELRLKAQRVEIEQARSDFRAAALAVVEGAEGAANERDKAWRRIGHAERALAEAEAALTLAQRRHIEAVERRTATETARRWVQAEKLTKEREALGKSIDRLVAELRTKFRAFTELGVELRQVAPGIDGFPADEVGVPRAEAALRLHMLKVGFRWAHYAALLGPDEIPSFLRYVVESNGVVLAQREKHALPGHGQVDAPAPAPAQARS